MKRLDSGLAVIPDPDPGRNDKKPYFLSFYEFIKVEIKLKVKELDVDCQDEFKWF